MQSQEPDSKNRRPLGKLIVGLCVLLIAALALIGSVRQSKAVQEIRKASLTVEGPRPMAKAVNVLESRCRCAITYEDPRYVNANEIADVTTHVRRDLDKYKPGEAPKVLIPKGGSISIEYEDSPASKQSEHASMIVRQLLQAHSAKGNAGQFRVEMSGELIHVVPTAITDQHGQLASQQSLLDAAITMPVEERRAIHTVEAICEALTHATNTKVIVGMVPTNLFIQRRSREGGTNRKARDILVSLLANTKRDDAGLSWQLLYDPGLKMYALNIHQVALR